MFMCQMNFGVGSLLTHGPYLYTANCVNTIKITAIWLTPTRVNEHGEIITTKKINFQQKVFPLKISSKKAQNYRHQQIKLPLYIFLLRVHSTLRKNRKQRDKSVYALQQKA